MGLWPTQQKWQLQECQQASNQRPCAERQVVHTLQLVGIKNEAAMTL